MVYVYCSMCSDTCIEVLKHSEPPQFPTSPSFITVYFSFLRSILYSYSHFAILFSGGISEPGRAIYVNNQSQQTRLVALSLMLHGLDTLSVWMPFSTNKPHYGTRLQLQTVHHEADVNVSCHYCCCNRCSVI